MITILKRLKLINKILPFILIGVFLFSFVAISFKLVSAESGFTEHSARWDDLEESMSCKEKDTYPYNSDTAKINSVGMDVLYGTNRGLISYLGETPYEQTRDDDGDPVDDYKGVYALDGTSMRDGNNGTFNVPGTDEHGIPATAYWGVNTDSDEVKDLVQDDGTIARADLQRVNTSDKIVSLRLYALSHSDTKWFSKILYWLIQLLARLALLIITLIVSMKNIDVKDIFSMLKLDKLGTAITSAFIWNDGKLSPILGFAIIMCIFAIAMYVYRYATGKDKANGINDLLIHILAGLLVIGICLTGRFNDLGSSIANFASKVMNVVAMAATEQTGTGDAFITDVDDTENENKIIQLQEISLVNKGFIDLQICTQFNVEEIEDLDFSNLGLSSHTNYLRQDTTIHKDDFSSAFGITSTDFDDNLGYYYWFANSAATEKTSKNKEFPSSSTSASEAKMDSLITALQLAYNDGDSEHQETIRQIILGLANPSTWTGCVIMLLYIVLLIALAFCLWKYAFNVVKAKLTLFIAMLGMVAAGPMLLSTNKKLVNTAKGILGAILTSIMAMTIYSAIFDLIIYTVSALISTKLLNLLALMCLVILLALLNPIIVEKVEHWMEGIERQVAPQVSSIKSNAKQLYYKKLNDASRAYDNSKKVVGFDENGEPIEVKREGNALSKALKIASNQGQSASSRESLIKTITDGNHKKAVNESKGLKQKEDTAKQKFENTMNDIKLYEDQRQDEYDINFNEQYNVYVTMYNDGNNEIDPKTGELVLNVKMYNEDNLNEEQKRLYNAMKDAEQQIENIKNSDQYKALINKNAEIAKHNANLKEGEQKWELSQEDRKQINEFAKTIQKYTNDKQKIEVELDENIREVCDRDTRDLMKLDQTSESVGCAIAKKVQEEHSEEINDAIDELMEVSREAANTGITDQSKVNGKTSLNKQAMEDFALASQTRAQVKNNEAINIGSNGKVELSKENKQIVQDIINANSGETIAKTNVDAKQQSLDNAKTQYNKTRTKNVVDTIIPGKTPDKDKQQRQKANVESAKTSLKDAKQNQKARKKEVKSNKKEAKQEASRTVTKATIDEQLSMAMSRSMNKNQEYQGAQPNIPNSPQPQQQPNMQHEYERQPEDPIILNGQPQNRNGGNS